MKTERLEAQSRRDNLRLYGSDDKSDESWEESETRVRYIDEHLNINETSTQIERAHRIRGKNSPRLIIVKLSHYKDKIKSHTKKIEKTFSKLIAKNATAPDNPTNETVRNTIRA